MHNMALDKSKGYDVEKNETPYLKSTSSMCIHTVVMEANQSVMAF